MPAYIDAYNEYGQDSKAGQLTVGWQSYTGFKPYYKIAAGGIDHRQYSTPVRSRLSRTPMGTTITSQADIDKFKNDPNAKNYFTPPPGLNPPSPRSGVVNPGVNVPPYWYYYRQQPSLSDHILSVSVIAIGAFLLGRMNR